MPRLRSFVSLAAVAGVALISTGCLRAPVVPPYGIIYSDIQAPLDHDFDRTVVPTRSGSSESISILGLVAIGDASIHAAAQDGGLSVIHTADYEYMNILGVYQKYVTVVRGE